MGVGWSRKGNKTWGCQRAGVGKQGTRMKEKGARIILGSRDRKDKVAKSMTLD